MGFDFTIEKVENILRELGFSEEEIIKLWLIVIAPETPLIEQIIYNFTFKPSQVTKEYIQQIKQQLRTYDYKD